MCRAQARDAPRGAAPYPNAADNRPPADPPTTHTALTPGLTTSATLNALFPRPETHQRTTASNLEDLQQLATLVNDMLFLANADRGEAAQTLEAVDLGDKAHRVVDYFDAALEECGQTIEVQGVACAPANAPLLRRALVNLVSNASGYTPAGGTIAIILTQEPGTARVAVRNPGPDIAPQLLPRLFDRSSAPTPRDGRMPNITDPVWRSCARWLGCTVATPSR